MAAHRSGKLIILPERFHFCTLLFSLYVVPLYAVILTPLFPRVLVMSGAFRMPPTSVPGLIAYLLKVSR